MGDVLAKTEQSKSPIEEDSWEYREDADGASSVEDSILRDIQEKLKLTRVSDDNYEDWDSITECCCDACQEPIMSIRNPHFDRVQEHWQKLRRFIQIVYKLAVVRKPLPTNYHNQIQCIIHELVTLEPHLLYKQLEAQIQEWVIETELRHLERLLVADKVKDIPHMFISGLLESYRNLMAGAELAFPVLEELEKVHLSKFNMTWSLLNEHIYQSSVYADPLVQNNVPLFIEKLGSTKESMKSNADLVKEFLCLDDSINSVAELWIDCERRLEKYAEEQEEIEGRRALLELEWKNFKEGGKTSLINKTLKTIVTRKKCIPDKNGACKQCGNQVNTSSSDYCSISHEEIDSNLPLSESRFTSSSLLNGNLPSPEQFVNTIEAVHKDAKLKNSSISSVIESMLASDCMTFECSPSSSSRPPTPPPQPFPVTSTSHSSHAHPHAQNHTQQQDLQQQPPPPHSQSNGKTNISTQQQIYNKAREIVIKKRQKPQACQKIRKTCSHHNHPHSLKHGEPVKRVSSCEQHRLQEAEESDGTSPPDDSCSDKSSTSTQKGSGDPRHCDCCYCEVFGHGGPSGAPVSRNYQEIRERLRLLLNKKKNNSNSNSNNKKTCTDASTAPIGNSNVKSGPPSDLLNKLPAPKQQLKQQQQQPQYKGDQCISDILDYIEGNSKIKDMKKAAKKARQKEKKLQEMYLKKLEEEAIERAKLDAEKKRKEELLREKERLIKEQQRLEKELQKQNQKLNNNRKALSIKNNNEKNIHNSNNTNNDSKKNKKKKQQQNSSQSGHGTDSSGTTKKKQKSKNQGVEDSGHKVDQIIGDAQEEAAPKMVTIKRVMETVGTEPTVTITLRGATPNEDKILYTLQNGHVCPIEEKNKIAAANNASAALNSTSKKSKKQQKKLNQQAAQQQQQPESQPRASMATHVQHSPGVVEINVNGGSIKPLTSGIKFDTKSVQNNSKKSKPGTDLPSGFSSMSVINVKPPPNGIVRKPVSTPAPAPELTTPSAIQISNAISSFTAQQEINFEDLRLPPGITITKVEAPPSLFEERSSPSTSFDGGDADHTNKENTSSQPSVSKKSKKKKNKQNQQHIASSEFIPNHTSPALTANKLQNDEKAIIKVKGSMVTIRNPAVFSNDTDATSQYSVKPGTGKKGKKDGRSDEWNLVDEESVFAPKDIDLENGDIDDAERELEAFKRFCSQSVPPKQKEKVKVNLNIKDIVLKKKRAAISCS